jgi:carboxypeptidase C (cathepsin A)
MVFMSAITSILSCLAVVAAGLPPKPEGVTTLQSKFHPGVTISYKQPEICETTKGWVHVGTHRRLRTLTAINSVRSFSGYVHLPANAINETHERQDYPINTFFWFFEARKDPENAPLAIWLNGGPGGSSLMGALSENGPCFINNDSNSTYLNPWSWNSELFKSVNVLLRALELTYYR